MRGATGASSSEPISAKSATQIAVRSSQAAGRSVPRSGTSRTSCHPVWCPVYSCTGPGHWSTSQPRTQELSGIPSCTTLRNTSTDTRLPTGRPVTSAEVTITVPNASRSVSSSVIGVSHPPSTGSIAPVMNDASSESRNEIAAATSSGSPTRGTRSRSFIESHASGERRSAPGMNEVAIGPGATALTRIPRPASSTASAFVSIFTPPFDAL